MARRPGFKTITMQVSDAEHAALNKAATAARMKVATFTRRLLAKNVTGFAAATQAADYEKTGKIGELEPGWRSRFYRDRYQLIAVWNEREQQFIFQHLHLMDEMPTGEFVTLRCDEPLPAEVAIYAPESADETMVRQQAAMDLFEQVDSLLEEFA